jgi:hypothetical protein
MCNKNKKVIAKNNKFVHKKTQQTNIKIKKSSITPFVNVKPNQKVKCNSPKTKVKETVFLDVYLHYRC